MVLFIAILSPSEPQEMAWPLNRSLADRTLTKTAVDRNAQPVLDGDSEPLGCMCRPRVGEGGTLTVRPNSQGSH